MNPRFRWLGFLFRYGHWCTWTTLAFAVVLRYAAHPSWTMKYTHLRFHSIHSFQSSAFKGAPNPGSIFTAGAAALCALRFASKVRASCTWCMFTSYMVYRYHDATHDAIIKEQVTILQSSSNISTIEPHPGHRLTGLTTSLKSPTGPGATG